MARKRKPNSRKNRIWTEISGTTLSTLPSGVTIDSSGIITAAGTVSPTELSYLDGAGGDVLANDYGTGFSITGASVPWAGVTIIANHGFTTLQGFVATYSSVNGASAVSPTVCELQQSGASDANQTIAIMAKQQADVNLKNILAASGGTIFWMAFGM